MISTGTGGRVSASMGFSIVPTMNASFTTAITTRPAARFATVSSVGASERSCAFIPSGHTERAITRIAPSHFAWSRIVFKLAHAPDGGAPMEMQSGAVSSKMQPRVHFIPQVNMSILDFLRGEGPRSPHSIRHNGKRLSEILAAHEQFVRGKEGGVRADLAGADLTRANLFRANLAYADLQGANLEGANLREAKLASADLSKSYLRNADLRKADCTEAHLSGADLTEAQAGGTEFFRADLSQAVLRRTEFGAANFRDANVHGADFEGAILKTAILRETKLDGVDLSRADLSTAILPPGYRAASATKS